MVKGAEPCDIHVVLPLYVYKKCGEENVLCPGTLEVNTKCEIKKKETDMVRTVAVISGT